MADFRSLLHRLADANLLAWEDMPADLAREVREALADDSTPSPAPTDSGADPARGEGASGERRACGSCRYDGGRTCAALGEFMGDKLAAVDEWATAFCDSDGVPIASARNCPGWAPHEAGEVSDG